MRRLPDSSIKGPLWPLATYYFVAWAVIQTVITGQLLLAVLGGVGFSAVMTLFVRRQRLCATGTAGTASLPNVSALRRDKRHGKLPDTPSERAVRIGPTTGPSHRYSPPMSAPEAADASPAGPEASAGGGRWAAFRGLSKWQLVLVILPVALFAIGGLVGGMLGGAGMSANLKLARADMSPTAKAASMMTVLLTTFGAYAAAVLLIVEVTSPGV